MSKHFQLPSVVIAMREAVIVLDAHVAKKDKTGEIVRPFIPFTSTERGIADRERLCELMTELKLGVSRKVLCDERRAASYCKERLTFLEQKLEEADEQIRAMEPAVELATLIRLKLTPRVSFARADAERLEQLRAHVGRMTKMIFDVSHRSAARLDKLAAPFGSGLRELAFG